VWWVISSQGGWSKEMKSRTEKVVADLETFGWHVVCVKEDSVGPAFAYSIGLQKTFGHPEIGETFNSVKTLMNGKLIHSAG
jgi:Domain of unknown function (DUF4262)